MNWVKISGTPEQIANRQAWIAALRSGKYKQGLGVLHNVESDTWCCLGVAGKSLDLPSHIDEGHEFFCDEKIILGAKTMAEKLGMEPGGEFPRWFFDTEESLPFHKYRTRLTYNRAPNLWAMNDLAFATFPVIADLIEAVWVCE